MSWGEERGSLGGGGGPAREVVPGGGTTGRAGMGAGGGAAVALCDRSGMNEWIGESALSIAGKVGRVPTVN